MATRELLLPDLGEGLEDAEIVQWLVAVGDRVEVDQLLVEVETSKANVELPSPFAGVVVALHGEPGTVVSVGAPLAEIDETSGAGAVPESPTEPEPVRFRAPDEPAPARPLVGYGDSGGEGARRRRRRRARDRAPEGEAATNVRATPPVRRMARQMNMQLTDVAGTGLGGRITRRDLTAHAGGQKESAGDDSPRTTAILPVEGSTRVPIRGVRRGVAEKMTRSHHEIPHAATWVDADATELLAWRDAMNARQAAVRVTPLALVARVCVAGLRRFPVLNARLDPHAQEIELLAAVHLGFAAQTERGLVVPVIRNAQARTTLELAAELNRLAGAARDGTLAPADLTGGTFTVSNYGSFGVDGGAAIINHPEVAILGIGRVADKPWVSNGSVSVRAVVQLSLSFDHRVMDGGDAGGFLRFVADCIESPAALLAEL